MVFLLPFQPYLPLRLLFVLVVVFPKIFSGIIELPRAEKGLVDSYEAKKILGWDKQKGRGVISRIVDAICKTRWFDYCKRAGDKEL